MEWMRQDCGSAIKLGRGIQIVVALYFFVFD